MMKERTGYLQNVYAEIEALGQLLSDFSEAESGKVIEMARIIADAVRGGNVVFTCGNGGSAADAQHIAGELVGRFRRKVKGYKAFALTTNSSIVTAIANDFSYEEIFSKQLASFAKGGDVLLVLSTSGTSPNVVRAVEAANELGMASLAFEGGNGGRLAKLSRLA
ncbi:MAG: SIS domain-containing protein, partial [Thermoplasmata archaeon]|nr:SIS domain-containing protein [Thermoplasmata archaeon]